MVNPVSLRTNSRGGPPQIRGGRSKLKPRDPGALFLRHREQRLHCEGVMEPMAFF